MIQRFSIFKLFLLIAVAAVTSLTIRQAFVGADWAKAFTVVVLAVGMWVAVHMLLTLLAYLATRAEKSVHPTHAQSPFATDQPAPQVIPPRTIESE